jgi:ribonucleoside-triphosphate reductase
MRPESTTVFSFPKKAPHNALLREDLTAVQHLDLWMMSQQHWCEHQPSVTISVTEDEWVEVGAWVWKNFDDISGVSFLPYDGGTYKQAPYEECSEEEYLDCCIRCLTLSIGIVLWRKMTTLKEHNNWLVQQECVRFNLSYY